VVRAGELRRGAASGTMGELGLRVISGGVLILIALLATWMGGWLFTALWFAAGLAMAFEWIAMSGAGPQRGLVLASAAGLLALALVAHLAPKLSLLAGTGGAGLALVAVVARSARDRLWTMAGFVYAALVVAVPVLVRDHPGLGAPAIMWMCVVVWATDIAAFFVGRRLGGPKLWPRVSPGKTWSGFCGGLVAGTAAGLAVSYVAEEAGYGLPLGVTAIAVASALASVASQLGDLGESALKRRFAVKDSGHLIPGHGGVMDRLDGFVAVAALVGLALVGARLAGVLG
jgi:phosphatidate cytidylyltransferase